MLITPEEYLEGEKYSEVKHEYVAGHVYAMVGTSEPHNQIAINLTTALKLHLRGGPCRVFMSDMSDMKVR
ncbi:MAG TPA: Uma2 family endonuclease, partial [Gammaproteobacteria bacterium]|nr:Uma2 family endonuclease [Gammaproteobacteria bacterium]